jgi:TPR repeat protein
MRKGLVSLAVVAGLARGAGAAETWIEIRTTSFTVVSNANESTARKTGLEFEQARAAYGKLWPWMLTTRIKPAIVVALKDEASMRRWAPGFYEKSGVNWVSGWSEGADRLYLLLRTDARPAEQAVTPNYNLYRAYLRSVLSAGLERPFPEWLSNGLAGVLANISVYDKEILIGRPVPWELQQFGGRAKLPLQTVLDARHDSPLLRDDSQRLQFDAQCYVLVHYLLFADRGAHASKLANFQRQWLAGASPDKALREGLGDYRGIEDVLPSYATRPVLSYATYDTEARIAAERPGARTLSRAEVAGLQAMVHVAMNRPGEAQGAIRAAREADPRLPASFDAEGLLADRDRDRPRAKEAYNQAVELGTTSSYSHYRAAQLLWTAQPDAATLALMRRRLERAVELDPGDAGALSFLGETLVQQNEGQAGLPHVQRAVALEPGRSYHRVALARVLFQLGRPEEARASAELGLRLAQDENERSNAERYLLFLGESARFAKERTRHDETEKLTDACQNGDAAACERILPDLERACGEGRASTCSYLAWLFRGGHGVAADLARAADYLGRACSAGDRKNACVEHAWMRLNGDGLAKDEGMGAAALQGLCDEGVLEACTRLAISLLSKPAAAERRRAKALFSRACEAGQQEACSMVRQIP